MIEHAIIWLEPWCDDCARRDHSDTGRTWCCDPVYEPCECGQQPAKYILAKEADPDAVAAIEALRSDEIERLRADVTTLSYTATEKATEVERLRAENRELRAALDEVAPTAIKATRKALEGK